MARILGVLLILCAAGLVLRAAEAEKSDFAAAMSAFQDGFAERAESLFADFILTYTNSPRVAQAIVMQARAAPARSVAIGHHPGRRHSITR